MSLSPAAQGHALVLCLAAGALLGLVYDLLRQLRLSPLPRWAAARLDLAFGPLALGCLLACALALGDGHVRL